MKIGIIGAGNIGGTVGPLLKSAGHDVRFGVREPGGAGPDGIEEVSIIDAVAFGDAVLCAVPLKAWPELAGQIADQVRGKIVIDAANPDRSRDGEMAVEALQNGGAGAFVAALIPGARLVRTFSTIEASQLAKGAHRDGDLLGLPVAGDDRQAVETAAQLVRDAGFEPVILGPLAQARRFDSDSKVFNTGMSGPELAAALGVEAEARPVTNA